MSTTTTTTASVAESAPDAEVLVRVTVQFQAQPGTVASLFRRANGELLAAFNELPDWVRGAQALNAVGSVRLPTIRQASLSEELAALIVRKAAAGESEVTLAEVHELVAEASVASAAQAELIGAAQLAKIDVLRDMSRAVESGARRIFGHLNVRLSDVVDEARALGIDPAMTAGEAVQLDRVDQWRRMGELAAQYAELMKAGVSLRNALRGDNIPARGEARRIRNVTTVYPHWAAWATAGVLRDKNGELLERLNAPWPADGRDTEEVSAEWFRWLVATPAAEAWCPDAEELEAISAELDSLVAQARQATRTVRMGRGAGAL